MKAISCTSPENLVEKQVEIPQPGEGETLVRIRRVGICGTDFHAYRGNQAYFSYPRILGHELSGEVLEINGAGYNLVEGDQVYLIPYRNCNQCIACKRRKPNCCIHLRVFGVHEDGGMQEYITYPTRLVKKEDGLNLDELAILEPLSIGAHAVRRADIQDGEWVLVVGAGPIGISILAHAQRKKARLILMENNEKRTRFCKTHFDISGAIHPDDRPFENLLDLTGGDGPTVVFEATGSLEALETNIDLMAAGGKYILVGLTKESISFNHPRIHAKEASILCSRNATRDDFIESIGLLKYGNFQAGSFITHRASSGDIIASFENWQDPNSGVIKAMTIWD